MVTTRGLTVTDARVRFDADEVLHGVSLTVAPGEIVALVGPSGCGKSTLLRFVAGLEHGSGSVAWNDDAVTGLRPDQRHFGLMFQDHALFEHRSVGENVAFGLRMQGVNRADRQRRVNDVLDLVGLAGRAERGVDTLSGGEAQRVALARSLAPAPRLLMLDEPLGSLDRTLRDRLAGDLRRILTDAGVAAIHVTHDQEEAYAVADRLVVMRDGVIERDGPAAAVWADPELEYVARFLGHDNVLTAAVARSLGLDVTPGRSVVIRDAAIELGPTTEDRGTLPATVLDVRFRGAISRVDLAVTGRDGSVPLRLHTNRPPTPGAAVSVRLDPAEVVELEPDRVPAP